MSGMPATLATIADSVRPRIGSGVNRNAARAADLAADVTRLRAEGVRRLIASGLAVEVSPPVVKSELAFVYEATAKTRWPFRDATRPISWDGWAHIYGPRIAEMIRDGRVLLATASHDGVRVILGFALWDAFDVLTMLYVKQPFRGGGIGLKLLEASGVDLPLKALGETACWRRWVGPKCHDIPTVRIEESELAAWKREQSSIERGRMSLGALAFDRDLLPATAEGADE